MKEKKYDIDIVATDKKHKYFEIKIRYVSGINIQGREIVSEASGTLEKLGDIFVCFFDKENRLIYIPWHRIIDVVGVKPFDFGKPPNLTDEEYKELIESISYYIDKDRLYDDLDEKNMIFHKEPEK